jgi:predicted GIY-YIG superfamily endonuclease
MTEPAEGAVPTAVYRFYDAGDALLYVGATDDLERRWKHHSYVQPWWPEVDQKRNEVTWYPDRESALAAETAAIKAERPRINTIHAVERPPRPELAPADTRTRLTTTEVGAKVGASRYTVEREIHRGNLTAEQFSGRWVIAVAEADRWAATFRRYAEQRDRDRTG